jgi:hypothetical protein
VPTGVGMDPYAERGYDPYETPPAATRALMAEESFDGAIWECANGRGAISRVLRAAGYRVIATDLVDYGCSDAAAGVNFLAQTAAPEGVTTIITNPPFMHAGAVVRRALMLAPRVVMLLRLLFLESDGPSDILDGGQLARVYVFRERDSDASRWVDWFAKRQRHGVGVVRVEPGSQRPPSKCGESRDAASRRRRSVRKAGATKRRR